MRMKMKIFRYNPEADKKPHYVTYEVDAEPTDRVLDLLEYVKGNFDGTLSFRRSCAHGICGSDAMRINGVNHLACKVLAKDIGGTKMTIEPLLGLPVIKDLIVDMEPFFDHYRSVLPYFINDEKPPKKERLQSPFAVCRAFPPVVRVAGASSLAANTASTPGHKRTSRPTAGYPSTRMRGRTS